MTELARTTKNQESEDLSCNKRFALVTLGCKVNRVESDSFQAILQRNGYVVGAPEVADLIIVNTCTVTAEADKKARKTVRSLLKNAPRAQIVVTGCAASIKPEMFTSLDERVQVKDRAELFDELESHSVVDKRLALRIGEGYRTRVGLKIQDGCNNACTYCIVHVARGPARSVSCSSVISEASDYIAHGVKEIVLTGIDLGSYRSEGVGLTGLLKQLLSQADALNDRGGHSMRFRASSLEPMSITDDLIDLLASSNGRICRHLHLPLQSGSSKVLREMKRPYDAETFEALVDKLYDRIPELSLTTDIICGFPGETDADFEQTLDLARKARFSKIHVFPYSKREGTPAAARDDQVDSAIISERAARLRDLASRLRKEDRARRSGTTELVLVQEELAISESYHEIPLSGSLEVGSLLPVVLP